jgi:hypothetical protein
LKIIYLTFVLAKKLDQLDIGYRIEKQSVIIFEVRPDGSILKKTENKIAKVTFVKKERSLESVLATCADLKWHPINLNQSSNLLDFIQLIEKDEYGCFWG